MCNGSPYECGGIFECVAENQQWVDTQNKGKCNMPSDLINIPLTKDEIEQQIKSGKIKPLNNDCTHGDLCYKITSGDDLRDELSRPSQSIGPGSSSR